MSTFLYYGNNEKDKKVQGIIDAADSDSAALKLEKLGVVDCDLYETMTSPKAEVAYNELAVFSKQMATLYRTNISLLEGLLLLKEQTTNKQLQIAILEIHKLIHDGYTLAKALQMYNHIFTDYFIKIITIAEVSGTLELAFDELYTFYKNRASLNKKIKNMLIYPTILTLVLMSIVIFVVVRIMPVFNELLITYGVELPNITKRVINSIVWLSANIVPVSMVVAVIISGLFFYFNSEKGSIVLKQIISKSRLFNRIETRILAIHYAKSVATLLKSGMILSEAIELSNSLADDSIYVKKFEKIRDDIVKGEDFFYSIQALGIYSSFYSKMLSIGNDTGTLDEAFYEVAYMLDDELQDDIERLQKIFEPILMMFLGGIVALILISVALPMINILENII